MGNSSSSEKFYFFQHHRIFSRTICAFFGLDSPIPVHCIDCPFVSKCKVMNPHHIRGNTSTQKKKRFVVMKYRNWLVKYSSFVKYHHQNFRKYAMLSIFEIHIMVPNHLNFRQYAMLSIFELHMMVPNE